MNESPNTFTVTVEGVGTFILRKRNLRLAMQIAAESVKIVGGPAETPWQAEVGEMVAMIMVQTVTAPAGWDIELLDPMDAEDHSLIIKVWGAIRGAEDKFRGRVAKDRTVARA